MSPIHQAMLARFGSFSRNTNFFTTSGNVYTAMAPAVVKKNLQDLGDLGLIVETATGYKLTTRGRAHVDGLGRSAAPAPRRPDYVPPKWESARGAAADQHLQHQSLGNKPQIERV